MNLSNWRIVFFSVTALLIISLSSPFLIDLLPPRQGETFFALALLGENGIADDYYPGDEPTLFTDTPIKWQTYLYNHMGEAKQIKVIIRMASSETSPPNSTSCTPSSAPELFEIRRALMDNETMILPFEWRITGFNETQGIINISKIQINEHTITTEIVISSNENLRMIFELWIYDDTSREFIFGWNVRDEPQCVWNQLNFEIST
jgi:hypothetical protein